MTQADPVAVAEHENELLVQKVILAISSASVPHPGAIIPGALESRCLAYYLGVGIDHLGHDYRRREALLTRAAEFAINAVRAALLNEDRRP